VDNSALLETAQRVVQALQRGDWNAFCRECTPTIIFQDYSRAYPQNYPKGLYDREFGSRLLFDGHSTDYAMNVLSRSVKISRSPSKEEQQLFRKFCHLIVRNQFQDAGVDQISVSLDLADDDEARFLNGPGISGRIANNTEWRIQMELREGKWKVRSLIVASH